MTPPPHLPPGLDRAGSLTRLTTTSEEEITTYSSADEASRHQPIRAAKLVRGRSRDDGKGVVWRKKVAGGGGGGSRPSNLSLQQGTADPTLSRSYDCLVNPNSPLASPKQDKKVSPLLPSVGKSPSKQAVTVKILAVGRRVPIIDGYEICTFVGFWCVSWFSSSEE